MRDIVYSGAATGIFLGSLGRGLSSLTSPPLPPPMVFFGNDSRYVRVVIFRNF